MAQYAAITEGERERLEMLIEECGEVIQAATKVLRHGYHSYNPDIVSGPTNEDHLRAEIKELFVVAEAMMIKDDFIRIDFFDSMKLWKKKLRWTHHQGTEEDWNG